jgi:hypothetical protein
MSKIENDRDQNTGRITCTDEIAGAVVGTMLGRVLAIQRLN